MVATGLILSAILALGGQDATADKAGQQGAPIEIPPEPPPLRERKPKPAPPPPPPAPAPQQDEAPPPPVQAETPPEPPRLRLVDDNVEAGWIDFDWLEFHPRVGVALFTDDYHIDPSPQLSFIFRAPMTCLSPDSDPGGEYFGIFGQVSILPQVTRDIEPEPDKPSGSVVFFGLGIDFTLLRNQSFFFRIHGGVQYGFYGGITDMSNGVGSMAGLEIGMYIGSGLTLTLGGESIFAHAGDRIYLTGLGLLIEF